MNQHLFNYLAPDKVNDIIKITKDQDSPANTRKRSKHKTRLQKTDIEFETQDEVKTGLKAHVKELIKNLKHTSLDTIRESTCEIRELAKNKDNRVLITNCGAIDPLLNLFYSSDQTTQENAVTSILNLSLNNMNKINIMKAQCIGPLIHVLKMGSSQAQENSAATLYSLSEPEENRVRIGDSGAIGPLVGLLGTGTARGKKDAATALWNLSSCNENRIKIVNSDGVKYLIKLMDPRTGMIDRAVAVLGKLAKISEGRKEIAENGGISLLVNAIELGSPRVKECAVAGLVHFCLDRRRYLSRVLKEGVVPCLAVLTWSGTPRAKEKAMTIFGLLRNLQAAHRAGTG